MSRVVGKTVGRRVSNTTYRWVRGLTAVDEALGLGPVSADMTSEVGGKSRRLRERSDHGNDVRRMRPTSVPHHRPNHFDWNSRAATTGVRYFRRRRPTKRETETGQRIRKRRNLNVATPARHRRVIRDFRTVVSRRNRHFVINGVR